MIASVLVANRGEIARRIFRTCRDLGMATVAVFSDADADAPFVREADLAVRLPGTAATDTYLRRDLIVDAARRTGADAVHPGYGFLAEDAGFAQAVGAAGLTWIGPPPQAIRAMGSKIEAKRLMAAAGVPVLPELDPAAVTAEDLPVLVKASAGGGGRGMHIVRTVDELAGAIGLARAEAEAAFGDPTVFCEPYLSTGRHLEVQLLADQHGTVWTVGERECSIQRRHQKVVEEAPSPLARRIGGLRERLFDAARAAAYAIDYVGAGTVEFLADDTGAFHFLEVNTRLQVEHPVTECTTGLDLVARQLAIADGARLEPNPPATHGHAIEVRLYAEDPATGWQPQSGPVHRFEVPGVTTRFGIDGGASGLRLDSGIDAGSTVSTHYDPMLAKVIAWAPSREQAAQRLAHALARTRLHGPVTNRDLLVNVLRHKAFLAGDTDTAFFETHGLETLAAALLPDGRIAALAAALAIDAARPSLLPDVPSGWRNVPSQPQTITLGEHEVRYRFTRSGLDSDEGIELVRAGADQVVLDVHGVRRRYEVAVHDATVYVDGPEGGAQFAVRPRFVDPATQVAAGSLVAPMPGAVARLAVEVGDAVTAGQPVVWLEAMKMQHRVDAPIAGVVRELPVQAGQQVEVGAVLAVVTSEEDE